jgi:hypothetical protein
MPAVRKKKSKNFYAEWMILAMKKYLPNVVTTFMSVCVKKG